MRVVLAAFFALAVVATQTAASAHMIPAEQATLNVEGNSVFEVVAVPASALHGADGDGDGRLTPDEVTAHESALEAEVGARFRVLDGSEAGTQELVMVRAEDADDFRYVLALMKTRFARSPTALRVETDLFHPARADARLTLRATRGKETEVAVLRAASPAHDFFRGPSPSLHESSGQGPWTIACTGFLALALVAGRFRKASK